MTSALLTYARAVVPKRGGGSIPDLSARTVPAPAGARRLRRYRRLCGLPESGTGSDSDSRAGSDSEAGGRDAELPLLYPHLDAFQESLALMARRDFPYSLPGLVHVANEVERLRRVGAGEPLAHRVWFGQPEAHPRGTSFAAHAEASVNGAVVWRSVSTYLRRERSASAAHGDTGRGDTGRADAERAWPDPVPEPPALRREWRAPSDVGRAYGAVSGDRNPIHLWPLTAKLFGFPRAIAHGMWTKARALAVLEQEVALPDAVRVAVQFRAPVPLPSELRLVAGALGDGWAFEVRDRDRERTHLRGQVGPGGAMADRAR